MTTIEKKAHDYVQGIWAELAMKFSNEPWNEWMKALKEIYLRGAKDAIEGSWRDPGELTTFEANAEIIAVYRTNYNGRWLTIHNIHDASDWQDPDTKELLHKGDELLAWMPFPKLTLPKHLV